MTIEIHLTAEVIHIDGIYVVAASLLAGSLILLWQTRKSKQKTATKAD